MIFAKKRTKRTALKNIIAFEFSDALRSRWTLVYTILLFSFSFFLLSMSSGVEDVTISLLNFELLLVPLFLLIYGTISFYNSLSFQRVILALGVLRRTLYSGYFIGRLLGILPGYVVGIVLAFIFSGSFNAVGSLTLILFYGVLLHVVFLAFAFFLSQLSERIEVLLAMALGLWFFLYILYDSLLLVVVIFLGDYPLEYVLVFLTFLNPIDTTRAVILMQGNLASLMTHASALYAKLLAGFVGVGLGTLALFAWAALSYLKGLRLYKKRDL